MIIMTTKTAPFLYEAQHCEGLTFIIYETHTHEYTHVQLHIEMKRQTDGWRDERGDQDTMRSSHVLMR